MASCFTPVRGSVVRVTRTVDGCCNPPGPDDPNAYVVSSGYVSLTLSPNVADGTETEIKSANGETCVYSKACPTLNDFTVTLELCEISIPMMEMILGETMVNDPSGAAVGLRFSKGAKCQSVAIETWGEIEQDACAPGQDAEWAYLLAPCVRGLVLDSDIVVQDGAATLTLTGFTNGGGAWAQGPYNVVEQDIAGTSGPLLTALTNDDHVHLQTTRIQPPTVGDCVAGDFPAALPFDGNGA